MSSPTLFERKWSWNKLLPRRVERVDCGPIETFGQDAKMFTPLFPQPGIPVKVPIGAVDIGVAVAFPKAQMRITSVGRTCDNWVEEDPTVGEALQRLDWRGVLAVAASDTADRVCARCAHDDAEVEEALQLDLAGTLATRQVNYEGGAVVVVELPIDAGRFKVSSCVDKGQCIGLLVEITAG